MPLDWLTPDDPPLLHSASACPAVKMVEKPATTSTFCGVSSDVAPEVGSRLSSFTLKEMKQLLRVGLALCSGASTIGVSGVKTTSFAELPAVAVSVCPWHCTKAPPEATVCVKSSDMMVPWSV